MNALRAWQRRHVNGSISEVTSVPGIGYWEGCVEQSSSEAASWTAFLALD
jgi:hypothetical protein